MITTFRLRVINNMLEIKNLVCTRTLLSHGLCWFAVLCVKRRDESVNLSILFMYK